MKIGGKVMTTSFTVATKRNNYNKYNDKYIKIGDDKL
jgi:hypothetical protein